MAGANERQFGGDHYRSKPIQVWDFITANGIPYLEGNAIKYLARWRDKGGMEDLLKARHYVEKIIENEEARPAGPPPIPDLIPPDPWPHDGAPPEWKYASADERVYATMWLQYLEANGLGHWAFRSESDTHWHVLRVDKSSLETWGVPKGVDLVAELKRYDAQDPPPSKR